MHEELKNIGEDYQKLSKEGFDATLRSLGEVNKGFQALTAEMTDYSKKAFDDGIHAWQQLLGVKSVDQALEIQTQYAKRSYDTYMAEMSKLGEMCVSLARNAYRPVEQTIARKIT
jgi:phasin family protein